MPTATQELLDKKEKKQPVFTKEEQEAVRRFQLGEPYMVSEFIDEDTIIAGYGKLDYDFEFPLPRVYIKQIYKTTSWSQRFKNLTATKL